MPAKPRWYRHLDALLARARQLPPDANLGRRAIEQLFAVKQTEAQRLMRNVGAETVGAALIVRASDVVRWLEALRGGEDYERQERRHERIEKVLAAERRLLPGRRVTIDVVPETLPSSIDGLPRTIQLTPGELHIQFHGAADLLEQLVALGSAMSADYARFQALVGEGK